MVTESSAGQAAIRVREALAAGEGEQAFEALPGLDRAHQIEILLGAALRDRRAGFAAVRAWYAGNLIKLCSILAVKPDTALDDAAVSLVVARRVDERWVPDGKPLPEARRFEGTSLVPGTAIYDAAAAVADGVGGLAILARLTDRYLYRAVQQYYVEGTIHALGVRPLLILAASPADPGRYEGAR